MNNFGSILRYNNSTSYALAIGLKCRSACTAAGQDYCQLPYGKTNPCHATKLCRVHPRKRLEAVGSTPGGIDGIIGANPARQIRQLQLALGNPGRWVTLTMIC